MSYFPEINNLKDNVFNLNDYGAVGDGVTDDTAAIQDWVAVLSAATIYNPLIGIARGNFRFSDEIEIAPTGASGTIHLDLKGSSFIWNGGDGTASTDSFTFDSAARTISRGSGSFLSDGFTADRWIEVSESISNNARFWVTDVTALTITVDDDIFAASPLTDETATCTIRDRLVCFRIGDGYHGNKWFYSSLHGLYLTQTSSFSNVTGLEIDHSDFMELTNLTIAVGGGVATGSRCLDISGYSKQGFGSVNSCTVTSLNTVGAEEGVMLDASNVFTLRGGKIQQHVSGFNAKNAAVVQLHTIDFSLNTQNAVYLDAVGAVDIHNIYAESNGPGTRGNDAKLFYIKDCRGVSFTGCNVNGTYGAGLSGTHPGYGIYLQGTEGVSIVGSSGKLCQRALLYCDANCRDVVVDASFSHTIGAGWNTNTLQPIIDDSELLVNRAKGRALTPLTDGLTNLIEVTEVSDSTYWVRENGVTYEGKTSNENKNSMAPILGFPDVSATTSKIIYTISQISNTAKQTLYFRVKLKLEDFQETVVADRNTDLAVIRLMIRKSVAGVGGSVISDLLRIGKTWDWYEIKWVDPPGDDLYEVVIEVRQSQEPINIAIDEVELYLVPDTYTVQTPDTITNLYAWYDAGVDVDTAAATPAADGETVEFWLDQSGDGYDLTQATAGNRPTFTTSSAYTGLPEVTFNGSNNYLVSSDLASIWNFLHDGTGCTIVMVIRPASGYFILDTGNASALNSGITIDWQSPDDIRVRMYNGTGTELFAFTTTSGVVPSSGAIVTLRHGSTATPNAVLRVNGIEVANSGYTGSPSASDPAGTLRLGTRQSGDLHYGGGMLEFVFYNKALSDTDMYAIETYIRDKYGFLLHDDPGETGVVMVNTTPYNVAVDKIYLVDASSSNIIINLPPATTGFDKKIIIKKIDSSANTVTIDPDGAETIDGQSSYDLILQYDSITVTSDGTQWYII